MSKRRKVLKWGLRVGVGLLLLGVIALIGADRWRAHGITQSQQRLETALARVDAEILKGKTPAEWQASRAKGSNGWEHIAFIHEAREAWCNRPKESTEPMSAGDEMWEAIEALAIDFEWGSELLKGESAEAPTSEQWEEWLSKTHLLARGYARAAESDCVVMLPLAGETFPLVYGERAVLRRQEVSASLGRCKALLAVGRQEQAWSELKACATVCAIRHAPVLTFEVLMLLKCRAMVARFALEQVVAGVLPVSHAAALLVERHPAESLAAEGVAGMAVWYRVAAPVSGPLLTPPGWFDWLSSSALAGDGPLSYPEYLDADLQARWVSPAMISAEVAEAVESCLAVHHYLQGAPVWESATAPRFERRWVNYASSLINERTLYEWRQAEAASETRWLELELRILELEGGPLADQPDEVAKIVARYSHAEHEFAGPDLHIGPAARLLRDLPGLECDPHGSGRTLVLVPIDQVRTPSPND